jgi:hypothetical protein
LIVASGAIGGAPRSFQGPSPNASSPATRPQVALVRRPRPYGVACSSARFTILR